MLLWLSPKGLAPTDTVLSIRGKCLSAVAAMSTRGIEDIDICEGTTNGEKFARIWEMHCANITAIQWQYLF